MEDKIAEYFADNIGRFDKLADQMAMMNNREWRLRVHTDVQRAHAEVVQAIRNLVHEMKNNRP